MKILIQAFAITCFSTFLHSADSPLPAEFDIQLKDPSYNNGVIATHEGGVIEAEGIRIQAQSIEYTDKIIDGKKVHTVTAEGDLMIDLEGRVFVGRRLEYDFTTKTGVIYEGKTAFNLWFMGGEKIQLNEDKSFDIKGAYITTSETQDHEWDIYVNEIHINKEMTLTAKNVKFRVGEVPVFWLPYYKSYLREAEESPIQYDFKWNSGQNPQLFILYRIFSWKDFNFYTGAGYQWKKGPSAAIKSDYFSPDSRTTFLTNNFYSYQTFFNDDDPKKVRSRYRIQGQYDTYSLSEKTIAHISWDHLSDRNMALNFQSKDFQLNTLQQTQVLIRHFESNWIGGLNFRPRLNSYQGFQQELPTIEMDLRPFSLGNTGVISDNRFKASYLDYSYSDDIDRAIPDFESGRFSTKNTLYRPIHLGGVVFTPSVGFDGIFYSDSKKQSDEFQAVFHYDLYGVSPLIRRYQTYSHALEPYFSFKGLTPPTAGTNDVFIFSLRDGYHRLNQLEMGIRNELYSIKNPMPLPSFRVDLYSIGFFADKTYSKTFPKFYGYFEWNRPNLSLYSKIIWNFQEQVLDQGNVGLSWTVGEDYALDIEFRHRSKFDWRKDDHGNYILDVTRPISELLDSPLSDGRNVLLARLQFKIAPLWTLRAEGHFGWGRGNRDPGYSEGKVELITRLTSAFLAKMVYVYTVRGGSQWDVEFMMAEY